MALTSSPRLPHHPTKAERIGRERNPDRAQQHQGLLLRPEARVKVSPSAGRARTPRIATILSQLRSIAIRTPTRLSQGEGRRGMKWQCVPAAHICARTRI